MLLYFSVVLLLQYWSMSYQANRTPCPSIKQTANKQNDELKKKKTNPKHLTHK